MSRFERPFHSSRYRSFLLGAGLALVLFAAVAVVLATTPQSTAAQAAGSDSSWVQGFAQFDSIQGESTEKDHKSWCDLVMFDQAEVISPAAGVGRAAKPQFEDLLLVKYLDKASPKLQEAAAKGTVMPTVRIELVRTAPRVFYKYELTNARITKYNIGSTGQRDLTSQGLPRVELNGNESPVEELALTFEKIKVTYVPIKADGTADAPVVFSWDVVKNGTY